MVLAWLQALFARAGQMIELQHSALSRLRDDRDRQRTILQTVQRIGRTMATQEQLDALTARISAANDATVAGLANIRQDIADLKANNPSLDTTALEATVARLESNASDATELAGENPTPPA